MNKNIKLPTAIFIMGPTASGKTALAIELSKFYPIEIISVDSALIYRGMNIGTAKPNEQLRQQVPHHLIDICEPHEIYSVAQFFHHALKAMKKISEAGKMPCLVGGTMLYFKALLEGLSELPAANPVVRAQLLNEGKILGWEKLYQQLIEIDPIAANKIHCHDHQRLVRALEVFLLTGKSLTFCQKSLMQFEIPYTIQQFAISPIERNILHQKIECRFLKILSEGFEQEVKDLMTQPHLSADLPSMRSVGYRQMWRYLLKELSYKEMVAHSIYATRQLAKRQLTWLRNWPHTLHWLKSNKIEKNIASIKEII